MQLDGVKIDKDNDSDLNAEDNANESNKKLKLCKKNLKKKKDSWSC